MRYSLFTLVLFIPFIATAQLKTKFHYKIKGPVSYTIGNRSILKQIGNEKRILGILWSSSLKAELTESDTGRIKVSFWGINPLTDPLAGSPIYVNSRDNADNFYIDIHNRKTLSAPISYLSIPYANFEIGAITLPYKYWPGNSDKKIRNNVVTDINAGIYIGRQWGRKRFYFDKSRNHESGAFTVAAFFGPTKIDLTEDNVVDTTGFKASSELGISTGLGAVYSYRSINVGLFGGADVATSAEGQNWRYDKKFWIGFGVGYSIKILGGKD